MRINYYIFKRFSIYIFFYIVLSIPISIIINNTIHLLFAWNVVLAYVPLILSISIDKYIELNKKIFAFLLFILWFFFYPNAFYLITDLIHLGGKTFYLQVNSQIIYTNDYKIWWSLLHILMGIILALFTGVYSLYIIKMIIEKLYSKRIVIIFIIFVSFLSSIGIYIGRFLRFNSWDIFLFHKILIRLSDNFSPFTLIFILSFTFIHLVIYSFLSVFFESNN